MSKLASLLWATAVCASCADTTYELSVNVATGLVAGAEFTWVQTTLTTGSDSHVVGTPLRADVEAQANYSRGVNVAQYSELAEGEFLAHVVLYRSDNTVLIERRVRLTLHGDYVLTVHLTRDCVGVTCDGSGEGRTECLDARCIDPQCVPNDPSTARFCMDVGQCTRDSDCTVSSPCAHAACVANVCLEETNPMACAEDEWCDPSEGGGCRSLMSMPSTTQFEAYVKATNTDEGDHFGDLAVTLSADGNTMAVGAHLEASSATGIDGNADDDSAEAAGAVYVFVRTANVWAFEAYLKASNTGAGDHFGNFVSLSDDGNTLAVGAPGEGSAAVGVGGDEANNDAAGAGAAYVFTRDAGTWTQQAYLKASNTDALDAFGKVELSGDGDTLAVGAPNEDSNARGIGGDESDNSFVESGAVYVFRRSAETWAQEAYVKARNADGSDAFGTAIALSIDGNTMAVGALFEAGSATGVDGPDNGDAISAGAAYVFRRSGAMWMHEAYIKASNTEAGDQFGASIALAGDGNTLAVGAVTEDSGAAGIDGNQSDESAASAGALYVYTRSDTTWVQQAYIKASNPGAGDELGNQGSLAISNDGDTIVVGSHLEDSDATGVGGDQLDNSAMDSGAVYVFTRNTAVWTQADYVKASNTAAFDEFAWVALSGDGSTLAVGASREDSDGSGVGAAQANDLAAESGAVYVWRRRD